MSSAMEGAPDADVLSERAKTVMDMFDLAGAPVKPVVARLVRVDGGEPIEICEGDTVLHIGRSKEIPLAHRLDHPKMSSKHCELRLTPATLIIEIMDTSSNGTFVNGVQLEKGKRVVLQPGDTVSFLNPAAPLDAAERRRFEYLFQRLKAATTEEEIAEELTCGICRQLFHRACTVLPCLHVFCGHCISQWMGTSSQCPECRGDIYEVRPTHKINNLVEQLLSKKPELKRSADEIKECDKLHTIPPTGKVIKKRPREESSGDEYGSDDEDDGSGSDSDDGAGGGGIPHAAPYAFHFVGGHHFGGVMLPPANCAQCTTPASDGFMCPPGGIHIRCYSCKTAFPERPLCGIAQRCEMCRTPFCDLYLGGCKNPAGVGYLQPIKDHAMDAIPARLFNGNTIEQSILSSYLATVGMTVQATWAECLKHYNEGSWSPEIAGGPSSPAATVCKPCCQRVFAGLLYHYRRSIPRDALPPSVTARPNCWYGIECRTQYKNIVHAQNYNHACPQEKRKE